MSATVNDLNGQTWVINESVTLPGSTIYLEGAVDHVATCNDVQIETIQVRNNSIRYTYVGSSNSTTVYTGGAWVSDDYRELTFTEDGLDENTDFEEFIEWLEANGEESAGEPSQYYITNDLELTSIAKAIRKKTGGNSALEYPADFVSGIGQLTNTSDATAAADKIRNGYTAYANGEKITGSYVPAAVLLKNVEKTYSYRFSGIKSANSVVGGFAVSSKDAILAANFNPTLSAKEHLKNGAETSIGVSNFEVTPTVTDGYVTYVAIRTKTERVYDGTYDQIGCTVTLTYTADYVADLAENQ